MVLNGQNRGIGRKTCTCDEAQALERENTRRREEEDREREERAHRQRVDELSRNSMMGARFKGRTFDGFEKTPQNEMAYRQALAYASGFDQSQGNGLLFTGTVGTGKTHLAASIALNLIEREFSAVFGTVNTLLMELRNTYDDNRLSEQDVFNRLVRCQLLVIDDLGKEKVSDWSQQTLYEIINTRYENNRSLIITTNNSLSELRQRYTNVGDALIDRIIEMCQGVKMNGDSWRRKGLK